MSIRSSRRNASIFATADDEALFAAVAALNFEAVVETYDRHTPTLSAVSRC